MPSRKYIEEKMFKGVLMENSVEVNWVNNTITPQL